MTEMMGRLERYWDPCPDHPMAGMRQVPIPVTHKAESEIATVCRECGKALEKRKEPIPEE